MVVRESFGVIMLIYESMLNVGVFKDLEDKAIILLTSLRMFIKSK